MRRLSLFLVLLTAAAAMASDKEAEALPPEQRAAGERRAQEMFEAAFRGEHTDEVADMMESHFQTLMRQDPRDGAPRIADLLGSRAAIEFAARRYPEAEKQVRRLLDFARLGRDDTLFLVGMRKTLAAAAYRGSSRRHEVDVLSKLKDELGTSPARGGKAQLEERLMVALLDCMGTAYMFDGLHQESVAHFREARGRAEVAYERIEAPSEVVRQMVSASSRIFPRAGLVAAHLARGDYEASAAASDELIPLVGSLVEAGVLPQGHPARLAADGSIEALRHSYAKVQAARKAKGEKDIPATLEERLKRRAAEGMREAEAGPAEPVRPGPFAPRPAAPAASEP
jgi:hypothetical protein